MSNNQELKVKKLYVDNVLVNPAGSPAPLPTKFYVVDPGGGPNTYTTIAAALAQIVIDGSSFPNSATVAIRPGQYVENLTIPVGVHFSSLGGDFTFGIVIIVGSHTITTASGSINTNLNSFSGISLVPVAASPALTVTGSAPLRLGLGQCNLQRQAGSGPNISFNAPGGILTMRGGFCIQTDVSASNIVVDSGELRIYDDCSVQGGLYALDLTNAYLDLDASTVLANSTSGQVIKGVSSTNGSIKNSTIKSSDIDSDLINVDGVFEIHHCLLSLPSSGAGFVFNGSGTLSIGQISYADSKLHGTSVTISKFAGDANDILKHFTFSYSDFSDPSMLKSINLFDLPSMNAIKRIFMKQSVSFVGGTISAYTFKVGITGNLDKYSSPFDALQPVDPLAFSNSSVDYVENVGNPTTVFITAESVGDNLDQATAGTLDVIVEYEDLYV